MREIEFRAWDTIKKGWIKENFIYEWLGEVGSNSFIHFMQYTGLKDKNGVEIYEGDIVVVNDDGFLISEVFYFGCMFAYRDNICEQPLDILCGNSKYSCEVIGNIYDNPELLDSNQS